MKKLFTFLILFSVNSFAEEYCYASYEDGSEMAEHIQSVCDEGDVLFAILYQAGQPDDRLWRPINIMNWISILFCDFDKEIIINRHRMPGTDTYLQCIVADNKPRTPKRE